MTVLNRVKFLKERVSISKKVQMLNEKKKEEDYRLRIKKHKQIARQIEDEVT